MSAPHATYLTGAVDDYVIRLELPGGVVHDCTPGQAGALGIELAAAQATALRVAARDRRPSVGRTVIVSITVGTDSMRLVDASTVHVVMPADMTYRQAEALAGRHIAELRREAAEPTEALEVAR